MINEFKLYLAKKGYTNHETRNFSEDMHGVRCEIQCDARAIPNELRKDFTQVFETEPGWFNVRLGRMDFNNTDITGGLFSPVSLDRNCYACGEVVDFEDPNIEIRENGHVTCGCSEAYSGVTEAQLISHGAARLEGGI